MRKYIPIFIIIFFVILSGIAFLIFWQMNKFSEKDVSFEIIGPNEVEAGFPEDFAFLCTNNSRKELGGVKVTLEYSKGILESATNTVLTDSFLIDNIPANGSNKKQIRLSLFGKKEDIKEIKARIEFIPQKSNKAYFVEAQKNILIKTAPFFLRFDTPVQAATGQEIGFAIEYTSKSRNTFPNFALRTIYPQGFQFLWSNPNTKIGNNIWGFGDLKPKSEGKIQIGGSVSGIKEENKNFRAEVGIMIDGQFLPIYEESKSIKILSPFLAVEQFVNGESEYSADFGEIINFSIKYKNNTKEKLREVFINTDIKCEYASGGEAGDCLSWKELEVVGGEFDGFSKTVSWKASGIPALQELSPGEEGEVKFVVRVKDDFSVKSQTDKNFVIKTVSKINMNPQLIPKSLFGFKIDNESVFVTKINSKLTFSAKGYFRHKTIQNSGPIPPKVGQITTYAIVWQVGNYSNDLKETVIEARLPANVIWKDQFFPKDANIKYQPFTGKIIWKIGELKAGSGYYLPLKEVVFQLAIQPTKDLIKKSVNLIEDVTAEGTDSFTGKVLKLKIERVNTDIPDDIIANEQGKVLP